MNEQEYKQAKQVLADAPKGATNWNGSFYLMTILNEWHFYMKGWCRPCQPVEGISSLSDLRKMVEQYERIAQLELWIEYAVKHNPTFPEWIQNSASCVLSNIIKGEVK